MSSTAVTTLQTIWGCRWSRPGYRMTGVLEQCQPEPTWVCIRRGIRETVPEERCETCEHWEADPERGN